LTTSRYVSLTSSKIRTRSEAGASERADESIVVRGRIIPYSFSVI
jgi:hypothetical protein